MSLLVGEKLPNHVHALNLLKSKAKMEEGGGVVAQ
jgi:hypothetical protein